MFNLFQKKNPMEALQKQHLKLLGEAKDLQRKGDIKGYALKTAEADEVELKIAKFLEEKQMK
jgi:hypothetical protein